MRCSHLLLWILLSFQSFAGTDTLLNVEFTGSPPLPDLEQLALDSVTLSDSSIGLLQDRLLQWYLAEGYPFASAGLFLSAADTLVVNAVPGRHALLEEVVIQGMPGTRPVVFSRLLSLEPGDVYSREAVEEWLFALERLKFVQGTGSTVLLLGRGGNIVISQELIRGSAGHFSAAMDWKGENLEGRGEVLLLNLAGTARELEISGETTEWGGLNAYLRYREPWILGIPLSLELTASQNTPESAWVNREASLSGIWTRGDIDVSAGAGIWRGYPPDGEEERYDFGMAGIEMLLGRRVPQGWNGVSLELQAQSGRSSGRDSSGVLTMASFQLQGHSFGPLLGFGGEVMLGGVMQGRWFQGLLEQLGGQATLRGYPRNSFRGLRYAVARPEISLGETSTRLYAFCDAAVIRTPDEENVYPVGAGIGIRGRSGIFNADAAAGFPLEDGIGSARIYLHLTASI